MMESVDDDDEVVEVEEEEREFDVDETIFVAVGKNVEKSKTTLFWAVHNFPGKIICLLHVHQPSHVFTFNKNLGFSKFKQHAIKAFRQLERQRIQNLLNEYHLILSQEGVEAEKVWIEMESVEKGIVEIIVRKNIKWLVMGAAADKCFSEKLTELRSKKAVFVFEEAPIFCHVWFTCNGYLIYTREGAEVPSELEMASLSSWVNSHEGSQRSEQLRSDSTDEFPKYLGRLSSDEGSQRSEPLRSDSTNDLAKSLDAVEDNGEAEGIVRRLDSQLPRHSSWSTGRVFGTLEQTFMLSHNEEKTEQLATDESCCRTEQAGMDSKDSKRRAFEEVVKRWKEEDNAIEANCKAKAMENLCVKEMSRRKEIEEVLAREKLQVKTIRDQCSEIKKELGIIHEQKQALQSQLDESDNTAKELEEKFFSAVDLLVSFRDKRDKLRIECEKAIKVVEGLKRAAKVDAESFCSPQILTFSFLEISEATKNFDPTRKMGEGSRGSVYRGLLCHMQVAIKMFPSYGLQSPSDFQTKVEVLSRVRHPNLVTLIGTCPESRSLVYEYLGNGSLEDRLACRNNTPPFSWQTRIRIASEICSILVFLHSNKPCIIHGNLKPSNILIDANFVSKLGDLGIFQLISPPEDAATSSTYASNSKVTNMYVEPEYLLTGKLSPESDVYSFGIILLQLLTGRPVSGVVKDMKCALENEKFSSLLDSSAGDWPLEHAELLARLALRCCGNRLNQPDLVTEIWSVLEPLKAIYHSPSRSGSKVHGRIPPHFVCPIFQEIMKDPQIAADGFTYEADAIKGWLKSGHNTSPMTNLKLSNCNLLPNYALHQAIQEWQQRY